MKTWEKRPQLDIDIPKDCHNNRLCAAGSQRIPATFTSTCRLSSAVRRSTLVFPRLLVRGLKNTSDQMANAICSMSNNVNILAPKLLFANPPSMTIMAKPRNKTLKHVNE